MEQIENYNEITRFYLETIYRHCQRTKGYDISQV